LRGFGIAVFVGAPLLALTAPAGADDSGVANVVSAVDETTTTTVAEEPAPLEGTPTTPPTTETTLPDPTQTTVPDPVTVPETDPTTVPPETDPTTVPPETDPTTVPPTTDTTVPTTDTTAPTTDNSTPAVVTPATDPPSGGSGGSTGSAGSGSSTSKSSTDKTTTKSHDAAVVTPFFIQQTSTLTPASSLPEGTVKAVLLAVNPAPVGKAAAKMTEAVSAKLQAVLNPGRGSWGDFGSAAPRFGPWIVLLAMAWIVRVVIASILADRTAGPRRRRWTLL
jgi:hypothetical protein